MTAPAGRLLVVTCALLLASVIAAGLVFTNAARDFFDELTQHTGRDIAMYVAQEARLLPEGRVNDAELSRVVSQAMVVNPLAEIYLLDSTGRVIGHRSPSPLAQTGVDVAQVRLFVNGTAPFPIYGVDPRSNGTARVFSAAEIRDPTGLQGYVYVLLAGAGSHGLLATVADSHALRAAAAMLAAIAALAIVAAWACSRGIAQPLGQLHQRVLELGAEASAGSRDADAPAGDDIAKVRAAVETLAARLSDQLRRLQRVDAERRDLFVNISHDLRTPLTAMRCSLDALLVPTRSVSPKERELLAIAIRHCERLHRLIGQIFSLARVESMHEQLRLERVEITELAQDIVTQFQSLASEGGVQLRLHVDPKTPAALADIGMLETVLQNLLENAVRHTPRGGVVIVSVAQRPDNIETAVSDTGCGIAAADLARVQRRFETGNGGRTGLGLAIVRRVLELHSSRLRVQSTPNVGTVVTFTLPAAPPLRVAPVRDPTLLPQESVVS
jgi:signal transduction histidine kinase